MPAPSPARFSFLCSAFCRRTGATGKPVRLLGRIEEVGQQPLLPQLHLLVAFPLRTRAVMRPGIKARTQGYQSLQAADTHDYRVQEGGVNSEEGESLGDGVLT